MKPASSKRKLPAHQSFPLSYQLVSQSLESIEFADSIELLFCRPLSVKDLGETI